MDEEDVKPRPQSVFPANLDTMSVENLKDYTAALKMEIERVAAEIAKRSDVRSAAEALFKKPGS
ncbi:MAG: DUF1192 domain-containing protein [Pseudomonadota bacterium]